LFSFLKGEESNVKVVEKGKSGMLLPEKTGRYHIDLRG